jgi:choline dehydrogenase-like flavoprotein
MSLHLTGRSQKPKRVGKHHTTGIRTIYLLPITNQPVFGNVPKMHASLSADIELVSALSAQNRYDYIVVGSGMGGGVVTRKLVQGGQRILLVEKGDLLFTTHCLNNSRPHWPSGGTQGPSQDNDVVYNAVKQKVQTAAGSDPYVGGPVYCLGGRSTVWGLFAPEISKATYTRFFPKRITDFLPDRYTEAFHFMSNGSQVESGTYPATVDIQAEKEATVKKLQDAIGKLYESCDGRISENPNTSTVSLAPIAAEFQSQKLYQFPQGAYSTVDALLDMAYGRDPNLTLLMNTEVLYLAY